MRKDSIYIKKIVLLLLISSQLSVVAGVKIFPETRRLSLIEEFPALLSYNIPPVEEFRMIPDPFLFGREIEEEKEEDTREALAGGSTREEILQSLGSQIQKSALGFQDFGERSFLATDSFGLLRKMDSLTINLPGTGGETASVQIISLSRAGFTLKMDDEELFVPLSSTRPGVTTSNPE